MLIDLAVLLGVLSIGASISAVILSWKASQKKDDQEQGRINAKVEMHEKQINDQYEKINLLSAQSAVNTTMQKSLDDLTAKINEIATILRNYEGRLASLEANIGRNLYE